MNRRQGPLRGRRRSCLVREAWTTTTPALRGIEVNTRQTATVQPARALAKDTTGQGVGLITSSAPDLARNLIHHCYDSKNFLTPWPAGDLTLGTEKCKSAQPQKPLQTALSDCFRGADGPMAREDPGDQGQLLPPPLPAPPQGAAFSLEVLPSKICTPFQ